MTAANFHRPPTRTADAAQQKRHESGEDYTRPVPRDHMGSPTPTSIGLVRVSRGFCSSWKPRQAKKSVKIIKTRRADQKAGRKTTWKVIWHNEFPKRPKKQHATKKEPSWDWKTSSPFDVWRQPKQTSLCYRAIWMPVAPNYGFDRCP